MNPRSSSLQLENFFDLSADLLCVVGFDGAILRVNSAWKGALGFAAAPPPQPSPHPPTVEGWGGEWGEGAGKPLSAFIHPDDWASVSERLARVADCRRPAVFECRCQTRDGHWRWLEWSVASVPGQKTFFASARDITEHKRAEDRIREQAALLDKAQDAIVVRDLEHRVLYWNKGAERVFGWPADEALGQNAFELLSRTQGAACLEALRSVVETGEWSGELVHATRSGGEAIVASRWTLVRDPEGRPKSILAVSTDITEKKKLESQFLRAQRLESIGTLASGVAHDLNNILAPIIMSVSLLRESLSDPDDQRLVETLQLCAQRGADMVTQILAFTRGREGGRAVINPATLVSEWAIIARETFPPSIQIETETGREIWDLHADATQLHQLLMNLCVNARDAMPDGGTLTICLRNVSLDEKHRPLHPDARPGRYVLLTVRDTGVGIAPERLDEIWESCLSAQAPGARSGLGLPSVLSIVRGHGGFAHVESSLGQGSCFEIYLPASSAPEPEPDPEPAVPAPQGRGETILVVDDERAIQELTSAIFAKHGYRVVTAGDGTEALALFAQQKDTIDLVVTDMLMPCLDGPATIRGLHRLKPGLPVIVTSGLAENEALSRELGRTTFLLKPFTTEKLLRAVSESLRAP